MEQNRVLIIGNSGIKHKSTDGQTIKVRLYIDALKKECVPFEFVDLEGGIKNIFKISRQIKKGIKKCDRIILLTASRGVKYFIPLINHFNKEHKVFILPMIGCNILNKYLKRVSIDEYFDYFNLKKEFKLKKKDRKQISKIDLILPENAAVANLVKHYFPSSNIEILDNFRFVDCEYNEHFNNGKTLKLVYLSRVWKEKGIFDLMEAIDAISKTTNDITLDIYGKKSLNDDENKLFNLMLSKNKNIKYCGELDPSQSISTLHQYDLFVFPTKYKGEGTPGVLAESLIAGTPILTSDFSNANSILKCDEDSIYFSLGNNIDLINKILYVYNNKEKLKLLGRNCIINSKRFIYQFIRNDFLRLICGYGK